MKVIVISGSSSNVGKTTLAYELVSILPNSAMVKIGHGIVKERSVSLYSMGTSFAQIAADNVGKSWLIIESNSILKEITPLLTIFLKGATEKPSAEYARLKADIVSETLVDIETIAQLAKRMNLAPSLVRQIVWLSGAKPEPVTAILLAGGKSSRMGTNKAMIDINGKPAIVSLFEKLSGYCDEILVSLSSDSEDLPISARRVSDASKGMGPLMGICSCMRESSSRVNFVIACDIPAFNPMVLRKLFVQCDEYDIVVPSVHENSTEPLCAVYCAQVLPVINKLVSQKNLKVSSLFPLCKTKVVTMPNTGWNVNINTPQEYIGFLNKGFGHNE